MTDRFTTCLPITLVHEGGWSDHPKDPGGATMMGITLETFRAFKKDPDAKKEELRAIRSADLQAIYRRGFWSKVHADDLPAGVDLATFDAAVNSGPARGAKWLQQALRVTADGQVGPATVRAARAADPVATVKGLCAVRMGFLRGLRIWTTFGRGWSRRVADIEANGIRMAAGDDSITRAAVLAREARGAKAAERGEVGKATGAGAAGGGVSLTDLPDWALAGAGVLVAVIVVMLVGRALHERNRAAVLAAASREP